MPRAPTGPRHRRFGANPSRSGERTVLARRGVQVRMRPGFRRPAHSEEVRYHGRPDNRDRARTVKNGWPQDPSSSEGAGSDGFLNWWAIPPTAGRPYAHPRLSGRPGFGARLCRPPKAAPPLVGAWEWAAGAVARLTMPPSGRPPAPAGGAPWPSVRPGRLPPTRLSAKQDSGVVCAKSERDSRNTGSRWQW